MSNRKGIARALLALCVAAFAAPRPPDLDVALPPGSPLDWGGSFPGYTPPEEPLFPRTRTSEPDPHRTRATGAGGAAAESEVRFAQSYGLLRILTWDLTAHLPWISAPRKGPESGRVAGRPTAPRYGDPLYWVGLAPLLRLWLHPELSSSSEVLAHLVELGDPILPVLAASAAEKDLAPYLARLRELVVPGGGTPEALPSEGPARARVFARFTLEECLRDEPYDPVGEFGKRLYLFHEEALPWLERYARAPALALRRNALAALARYRTRASGQTLAALALEERDPVALVRTLAALAGFHGKLEEAPLVERARAQEDPVLRAAWIGALGRLGLRGALPSLLEWGEQALAKEDGELLLAVLGALSQIPPTAEHARVRAFGQRVAEKVRQDRASWRARAARTGQPDVPDASDARASWLLELALLTEVAAEPLEADLHARLLALPGEGASDPRLQAGSGATGVDPLGTLAPGSRVLYLHALAQIGTDGQERLAALALARGLEAGLRGRALALTSYDRRVPLAARLAAEVEQGPELRIQALEVLRADRDAQLDPLCKRLLAELVEAPTLDASAPQRYLWTFALRHVTAQRPLARDELLPLWKNVCASRALQRSLRRELERRIDLLFQNVLEGVRGKRLESELEQLLVFARPLGPERDERAEHEEFEALHARLLELRKHQGEEDFAPTLRAEFVQRLSGTSAPSLLGQGFFEPSVPLEEELVLALGRAREAAGNELLLQLLRLAPHDLVGHACLALGLGAEPAVARELVPFLEDPEPFVRLCAGEALQKLSATDFEYDWVHGPEAERHAQASALAQRLGR